MTVLQFRELPFPARPSLPAAVRVVDLEASAEGVGRAFAEPAWGPSPPAGFLHLHPAAPAGAGSPAPGLDRALAKATFLLARHLKRPLLQAAAEGRAAWLSVSRLDGRLGTSGGEGFPVEAGGLLGLAKTLGLEWQPVFCRGLDLHPALAPERAAAAILEELEDPDALTAEVGRDPEGGRWTLEWGEDGPATGSEGWTPVVGPSFLCAVSGGGQGITARCAAELARRFRWRFLLLGRTTIADPEPAWASGAAGEAELQQRAIRHLGSGGGHPTPREVQRAVRAVVAQRAVVATLEAVRQAGGEAHYLQVDVTDRAAVRERLRPWAGEIRGLIHGAGSLADKLIEHKTAEDFEAVYAPKVDGLRNLLAALPVDRLDLVLLFSSVAGFYGNPGQADYAMANEVLNKLAYRLKRRRPAANVLAVDWGPWDSGMVTPELRAAFARRRIRLVPSEVGPGLLADELAAAARRQPQILLGSRITPPPAERPPAPRSLRLERRLTLAGNPFLTDHSIEGRPVLPATCALGWMANAAEQAAPGFAFFRCTDFKIWKGVVLEAGGGALDLALELEEVGGDEAGLDFRAVISSGGGRHGQAPRRILHYGGDLRLVRQSPPAPAIEPRGERPRAGPAQPSPYASGALFHGPRLQGIREIAYLDGEGMGTECALAALSAEEQGQFPVGTFNPYLLDVQGQSILVWVHHHRGALSLPSRIGSVEVFRPLGFGERFSVTMRVRRFRPTAVVADLVAHDHRGEAYYRATGIEVILAAAPAGPASGRPEEPQGRAAQEETP